MRLLHAGIILVFLSFSFFASGCATIIHSRNQPIHFVSEPAGASITIDDKNVGVTPLKVKLHRKSSHSIKMELPGHQPYYTMAKNKLSWWFFGNTFCLAAAPVCYLVDLFDGAMYEFDRDTVNAVFAAQAGDAVIAANIIPVEEKLNVAILDMRAMGVPEHFATLLTEKLRSELFNTGKYNVMNREDMKKVLNEKEFQQSELCDTPDCISQLGNMLGVPKLITGSIGKLGSTYQLTIKLIDTESSKNDKIINTNKKCDEDELFKMIEGAARELGNVK